jgi:phosphoglycolate phosphatase
MIPKHDLILFDLDGTISNPLEGIGKSINYALTQFNYKPLELSEIAKYIGPPLDETFTLITGSETKSKALIAKYRERYGDIGYSENALYPGINEALIALSRTGTPMAVCTSKLRSFAEKILDMFNILHHFQFISGGDVGVTKYQQIEFLVSKNKASKSTVMVGDRAVDIIAAHKNGLTGCGVLWGYGSYLELTDESPSYLFNAPNDLIQLSNTVNS